MDDRLPAGVFEHRRNADGHEGQHEQREGEGIKQLFCRGAAYELPLRERRYCADGKQREVQPHKGLPARRAERCPIAAADEIRYRRADIHDDAQPREDGSRHDAHGHVVAGKAAVQHPAKKPSAVAREHLHVAARPAHALPPGLFEGHWLLIVGHGVRAVADLDAVGDIVDGKLDILGQQEEVPAAAALENFAREQKARTRDGAAAADCGAHR